MLEATRLAQIIHEMDNYRLDILGICESRWNGFGEHHSASGELLLYSGKPPNEKHANGVALLITKNLTKSLIEWKPINDRILIARFKTKVRNLTIVQCYAPTEPSTDEDKDIFYETLNTTLNAIKKSDMMIVMGDFNAKVGSDNRNSEDIMGKHGLGNRNNNGDRLLGMCSNYQLTIGGTLFPHNVVHKATWKSPDGHTTNQIDHFLISRKWRNSLF
ncbi:craniofacial development protein 2-like [Sitophilus oryzae]|uniref:Craniofacial development protein 2-like n=1 Tax=Sitophilus oryzae TaxID=7048 RepID=A0A6J2X1N6_SITOR|nr:craniofacial development protein 2-like [Sitophilus oryzae]